MFLGVDERPQGRYCVCMRGEHFAAPPPRPNTENKAMRLKTTETSVYVWLSARDTYYWADDNWPGATLADRRVFVALDAGDLVDLTVDGREEVDVDGAELEAILSDHLRERLPSTHPCYPA